MFQAGSRPQSHRTPTRHDTHQNPYRSQGRSRAHQTHHQASPDRQMRPRPPAARPPWRICRSGEAWWWVWWARLRPWLLYGSWWVSGRGAVGWWWGFSAFFDRKQPQIETPENHGNPRPQHISAADPGVDLLGTIPLGLSYGGAEGKATPRKGLVGGAPSNH